MEKSLSAIRPYHAMLLLVDEKELLTDLPKDCSPSLRRIIKLSTPLKSLQQLSQDADLALSQVIDAFRCDYFKDINKQKTNKNNNNNKANKKHYY